VKAKIWKGVALFGRGYCICQAYVYVRSDNDVAERLCNYWLATRHWYTVVDNYGIAPGAAHLGTRAWRTLEVC
jgi:hypothetical protein